MPRIDDQSDADYAKVLRGAFAEEVRRGTYHAGHRHGDAAREFFLSALDTALGDAWRSPAPLRVLECGMGDGAWLETLVERRTWGSVEVSGFDLTPEMVALAVDRFARRKDPHVTVGFLRTGDITNLKDYLPQPHAPSIGNAAATNAVANDAVANDAASDQRPYDLVFCYDVIQQLPDALRMAAVECMVRVVRPQGRVVVFDKHRRSRHGIQMAIYKWVTAHTPLKLVPEFFLNTRYPNMKRLIRHARTTWGCRATLLPDAGRRHFAAVLGTAPESIVVSSG